MEKPADLGTHTAFAAAHGLTQISPRTLDFLYLHQNDLEFWKPKSPSEDISGRLLTQYDNQGRIQTRVHAYATKEHGKNILTGFDYEEWEYNDEHDIAIMKRGNDYEDQYTRRVYQHGTMLENVTATIYSDNGRLSGEERQIEIIKPMPQPDGTVLYATQSYNLRKMVGIYICPDTKAHPLSQLELGSHKGTGRPVTPEDYYIDVGYHKYWRGFLNLENAFESLNIPRSTNLFVGDGEQPDVTIDGTEFIVKSQYGEVAFPIELDFDQVFQSLKF